MHKVGIKSRIIARRKAFGLIDEDAVTKSRLPSAPRFCFVNPFLSGKNSLNSGQIILHREGEHDRQPEKSGKRRQPDQIGLPADVHKIQDDERHLGKRDKQRDKRVRAREDPVEIDQRDIIGQDRADDENGENAEITGNPDMRVVFLRL